MKTLIPLKTSFRKGGFDFEQIKRDGSWAIFSKRKPQILSYEVIRVGSHDGYTIAGKTFEPAEVYPSSEQWGSSGWTYTSMTDAEARFEQLRATKQSGFNAKL